NDTTEAIIRGGSTVTGTAGAVSLTANDSPSITADAGGVALALALGQGTDAAVSIGVSFVSNDITDTTLTNIDDSTVSGVGGSSTDGVSLTTTEDASIQALTIAGAAAVAKGQT